MKRRTVVLEQVRGKDKGRLHFLSAVETLIGRSSACDIQLPDDGVSRRHARISRQGDEVLVTDLGSKHGTFVDDVPVAEARVREGQVLTLGPVMLRLVFTTPRPRDPGGPALA